MSCVFLFNDGVEKEMGAHLCKSLQLQNLHLFKIVFTLMMLLFFQKAKMHDYLK